MLSIGSWLSWQAVRALVPWASPKFAWALAALFAVLLIWLHGYMHGGSGAEAAVAQCDLRWTQTIQEKNNEINTLRARAIKAGDSVAPTPDDGARRLQLCQKSPTCRDNRR